MSETCRGHLWEKIIVKLFASSWYIFLTYIYDARSHLHQGPFNISKFVCCKCSVLKSPFLQGYCMSCIYKIIAENFFELHVLSLFILILDFCFFFSRGEFIKGNVVSSTGLLRIITNRKEWKKVLSVRDLRKRPQRSTQCVRDWCLILRKLLAWYLFKVTLRLLLLLRKQI